MTDQDLAHSLPGATGQPDDNAPFVDRRKKAVLGVPIEVIISAGKARPLLSELVGLKRDSVLTLDS
jgi:flagellar motor switch protein FliN/FliY